MKSYQVHMNDDGKSGVLEINGERGLAFDSLAQLGRYFKHAAGEAPLFQHPREKKDGKAKKASGRV